MVKAQLEGPAQRSRPSPPDPAMPGRVITHRVLRRRDLTQLFDRATHHRVTLVCAPPGAGKTAACSAWAAARAATRQIIWVTLEPGGDQVWFWAYVCSALKQAPVGSPDVFHALENESASGFPLALVQAAQHFSKPVVLIVDNVEYVTNGPVLRGFEVLARHAPPGLRLVLSGRRVPELPLAMLHSSHELAEVGPADLAR